MVCFCVTTKAYHTRAVLSTPFSRKLSLYVFWRILAHRLRKLSLECIKTIPRLEGAKPWPSLGWFLAGNLLAVGALPPARLRAVRRAPRRLPRARPHCGGSARGFCGMLAPVGPSAGARHSGGPPLRASARAPARRSVARLSGGTAASVGLGLSAPALARRSGPRCPPLAPAVVGGLPLRPFGPPLWGGAGLSPLRARPGSFASPGPAGPPARPAAYGGGFALAPPRGGPGAAAPLPRPPRYRALHLRLLSRT